MGIPDRWIKYKSMGSQIEGSPFVAVKVPLRSNIFVSNMDVERFTVEDLVTSIPKLGLVVDLTNTYKYYSPRDLEQYDIKHEKLMTMGHHVPSNKLLKRFIRVVKDFHLKNPDKVIVVHCTHGVNRTGYFICSYLILMNGLSPERALEVFEKSRYAIERQNYIEALAKLKLDFNLVNCLANPGNSKSGSESESEVNESFNRRNDYSKKRDSCERVNWRDRRNDEHTANNTYVAHQANSRSRPESESEVRESFNRRNDYNKRRDSVERVNWREHRNEGFPTHNNRYYQYGDARPDTDSHIRQRRDDSRGRSANHSRDNSRSGGRSQTRYNNESDKSNSSVSYNRPNGDHRNSYYNNDRPLRRSHPDDCDQQSSQSQKRRHVDSDRELPKANVGRYADRYRGSDHHSTNAKNSRRDR